MGPRTTQPATTTSWWRIRVVQGSTDSLLTELWGLGTDGLEQVEETADGVEWVAYFSNDCSPEDLQRALSHCGGELVAQGEVSDHDWLQTYRRRAAPFALGRCFWVDPRELAVEESHSAPGDRTVLRIPAQAAFGTGTHESTRLLVELLELHPPRGCDVLDVGTGTGILALVALQLGARRCTGLDVDLASVTIASVNARVHKRSIRLFAGSSAAIAPPTQFDVVLVNILESRWRADRARLLRAVRSGGEMWVSGLLAAEAEALAAELRSGRLELASERRAGEWWAGRWIRSS